MVGRVGLFVATNFAVVAVLQGLIWALMSTGILSPDDQSYYLLLLLIALVTGFAGSIISLLLSKTLAKRRAGLHVIVEPRSDDEQWLVDTVHRLARDAEIGTPETAIYDAPELNAFATGPKRDSSLVAVSTGLMSAMSKDEVEAVLAHEIAHVKNGDMVTLTLIQGVVNTFVIFGSRVLGTIIDSALSRGRRRSFGRGGIGYFIGMMIGQVALGFLATIIVRWFSRWREFRADAGGASLTSDERMAAALDRLRRGPEPDALPDSMAALGISGARGGFLAGLLRTHPPLEVRIARLTGAPRTT